MQEVWEDSAPLFEVAPFDTRFTDACQRAISKYSNQHERVYRREAAEKCDVFQLYFGVAPFDTRH
mgnify:CR=1 FL=1